MVLKNSLRFYFVNGDLLAMLSKKRKGVSEHGNRDYFDYHSIDRLIFGSLLGIGRWGFIFLAPSVIPAY